MYRKIVLLLTLFFVNGLVLFAQKKELGVFKPGTKWENINTRSINVVYPSGYDSVANRVINITNFIHDYKLESIGDKNANRKLQIILAPNDLSNNLQIQLAPYKAIIPTTGPQNIMKLGGVDWLTQSSIFAYRRALQYSNLNSGIFRFVYWLNGDQGVQNLSSFTIPSWFFIGDATFTQTALTKAGIGYTPSFNRQQRARLLAGKKYHYPKVRNGSFIDVIEDQDVYGVSLIEQGRKIAGPDVWKKVVRSSANLHGIFYSFSNSTKKHIGYTTSQLYLNTYDSLEVKFQNEAKKIQQTDKVEVISFNKRFYESYSCLNMTKDGKLYALKRPLHKMTQIVEILPNKKEKTIVRLPKDFNEQYSIHNGWIVWSERRDNPFYKHLDYQNIFSYNLYTKEKKQISKKKKYFSPALSTDGQTIAVIEKDANFNRFLVTLDRKTGTILKKFPIIKHGDAFSPQWSYDNTKILYILQADSKLQIVALDIHSGEVKEITPLSDHMISSFRITEDNTILFSASYSGIDNIFKTNLDTANKIEQITSAKIGAYDPIYDTKNNLVYYCDYTDMGAKVSKTSMGKASNKEVHIVPLKKAIHSDWTTNKQERDITSFDFQASNKKTKYRPIRDGMKLHSWGTMYMQESFSLGIEAENILSNISAMAGYSFKESQNNGQAFGSLTYGKYAVKTSFKTEIIGGELLNLYEDSVRNVKSSIDLYLPIQWRGTNNQNSLNVGAEFINNNYSYTGIEDPYENLNISEEADFNELSLHFDFEKLRDKKKINLQPKWGFTFASKLRLNLDDTKMKQISMNSKIYFPGFFANDGFFVDFGYEHTRNDLWERFERTFEEAKGYTSILISDMSTGDLLNTYKYKGSYNYQIPLCYPDFGIAGILYFKRIFADGFADFQQIRAEDFKRQIQSYGLGLHFDINLLNDYPIQIGFRQCHVSAPEFSIFKGDSNPLVISLNILYL